MASVLIAVIYLAFISMGLPDALLGAAWPSIQVMWNVPVSWAGIITFLISLGTVLSSMASNRLIQRFGTGWVTVGCTALVRWHCSAFRWHRASGCCACWPCRMVWARAASTRR